MSASKTRTGQTRKERPRIASRPRRHRPHLAVGSFALVVAAALLGILLVGRGPGSSRVPPTAPPGTSAAQASSEVALGRPFPTFRITDVSGRIVTNQTLRGRPAIIWFTTSYCVPCQVGARVVARFEDRLGGRPFNVLVVFVDPGESPAALAQWRETYGRPDWLVALDANGMLSKAVGLEFLDSKYLLDAAGVVRNIDFTVADRGYLVRIQRVIRGAS